MQIAIFLISLIFGEFVMASSSSEPEGGEQYLLTDSCSDDEGVSAHQSPQNSPHTLSAYFLGRDKAIYNKNRELTGFPTNRWTRDGARREHSGPFPQHPIKLQRAFSAENPDATNGMINDGIEVIIEDDSDPLTQQ